LPSTHVKRHATKRITRVADEVTITNSKGETEKITKVKIIKRLAQPLKQWAREQISSGGEHASICSEWLRNKGCSINV